MLLTIKEVSAWLNIKSSTLYLWAATGKIPCHRIHGLIRFDRDVITRWLASFPQGQSVNISLGPRRREIEVDRLIAAAKRDVYTSAHGETISPSPSRKEDDDGAR